MRAMSQSSATPEIPVPLHGLRYRPHIDGLRALAVVAVVLYHAKLLWVRGGFVGVDVFFVISGFLIASIIVRDIEKGTFSLLGFWERRIRRIVPALFVVMATASIAAYFLILYPQDYHHFGNSMIAQSAFVSNILFMVTDNYFDQPSRFSPLLHTWSLSVEEQFYLLFPFLILLCVWLAHRFRATIAWQWQKVLLVAVATLGTVSLLLNIATVNIFPTSAFALPFVDTHLFWSTTYGTVGFYLLPTRAWELGLGIALALFSIRGFKIQSPRVAEIFSASGIIAIVASAIFFTDGTPFPGLTALVPTLGAALFIASNEQHKTRTGKWLSYPLVVLVGLISYSLYLWHWPVFVFAALASATPLTALDMIGLTALSLLLAWTSYQYIETPVRKKQLFTTHRQVYLYGLGALALLVGVGFFIVKTSASTARIPLAARAVLTAPDSNIPWGGVCFQLPGEASLYDGGMCRIGAQGTSATRQFVVWGDSHADALVPLFDTLGKQFGAQGVVFDGGSCMPIVGVTQSPPATDCADTKKRALQYIEDKNIKLIILVARWSYYVMGGPSGVRVAFVTDSNQVSTSPSDAQAAFARHLAPTVEQFVREGREVVIVKQVPEQFSFDTRVMFYSAVHAGETPTVHGVTTKISDAYQARANAVIDMLSNTPGVSIIDPSNILCEKNALCPLTLGSTFIYRDENHLSTDGALLLAPLFSNVFKGMR